MEKIGIILAFAALPSSLLTIAELALISAATIIAVAFVKTLRDYLKK